jgi:Protein of unknown function (DUF2996)
MPDEENTSPKATPEVAPITDSIAPDAPDANAPEAAPGVEAQATEAADAKAKPPRAVKAKAAGADEAGEKSEKAPKKEKAPALEDKPFAEFINQDYLPALTQTLAKLGVSDLNLKFEKRKLPIAQMDDAECWQVLGRWEGDRHQFIIIFSKENIQAPKFFSYASSGAQPSQLESFMIDERKVNLDLLLMYTVQRLNGQKWLVRN